MEEEGNPPREKLQSVLFVCTGNIFRSVAAEYALKAGLEVGTSCVVSSAGIDVKSQSMHDWVQTRLREKGADPVTHIQRQLTRDLVWAADLVVAMGRDHQVFVREQFGREVPLFNQICLGYDQPILDVHEVIPDWETDRERARAYVWSVIDAIWAAVPFPSPPLTRRCNTSGLRRFILELDRHFFSNYHEGGSQGEGLSHGDNVEPRAIFSIAPLANCLGGTGY